ncbi:hypothetical protein [Desulfurispora thermophila]|nr:hypothetical protein [Desulfurispora thermophila]
MIQAEREKLWEARTAEYRSSGQSVRRGLTPLHGPAGIRPGQI